jgi:hypothetical protein
MYFILAKVLCEGAVYNNVKIFDKDTKYVLVNDDVCFEHDKKLVLGKILKVFDKVEGNVRCLFALLEIDDTSSYFDLVKDNVFCDDFCVYNDKNIYESDNVERFSVSAKYYVDQNLLEIDEISLVRIGYFDYAASYVTVRASKKEDFSIINGMVTEEAVKSLIAQYLADYESRMQALEERVTVLEKNTQDILLRIAEVEKLQKDADQMSAELSSVQREVVAQLSSLTDLLRMQILKLQQ